MGDENITREQYLREVNNVIDQMKPPVWDGVINRHSVVKELVGLGRNSEPSNGSVIDTSDAITHCLTVSSDMGMIRGALNAEASQTTFTDSYLIAAYREHTSRVDEAFYYAFGYYSGYDTVGDALKSFGRGDLFEELFFMPLDLDGADSVIDALRVVVPRCEVNALCDWVSTCLLFVADALMRCRDV